MNIAEAITRTESGIPRTGMSRDEVVAWVLDHGYEPKRNHFQRTTPTGKIYRIKLCDRVIRYEVRVGDSWVRLMSGYYKDLFVNGHEPHLGGLTK